MKQIKEHRYHYLYKTVRPSTGEYYYGIHSTNDINDGYQGSGTRIRRLLKNGEFLITGIVEMCETRDQALILESETVNNTMLNDPLCLNIARGGNTNKICFGITEDTREKIRQNSTGVKKSATTKDKIAKTLKQNGCQPTADAIATSARNRTGKPRKDTTKDKISAKLTGIRRDDKFKEDCRQRRTGTKASVETRKKLSSGEYHTPHGVFLNSYDAAKAIGCTDKTVLNRCKSTSDRFKDWFIVPY